MTGRQALDHQRPQLAADLETQAVDSPIQPLLVDQPTCNVRPAEQLVQCGAKLRQARLSAAFEYVVKSFNHANNPSSRLSRFVQLV
jgi:hypothetical protein